MPSRVENTIMENYASVVLVNLRRVMREPYYDHKCIPALFGFFILCGLQLSFPLLCTALQCIQDLPKIERERRKKMRAWIIKIKIIVVHELSVNHWAVGWLAGSDVIPIRKPWNNGVGVTFQQPVPWRRWCSNGFRIHKSPLIISQLTLSFIIFKNLPALFLTFLTLYAVSDKSPPLRAVFPQKNSPRWPKMKIWMCFSSNVSSSRVISPHL